MNKLNSILAIVDRSEADTDVLRKAVALARQSGASVELFLCDADRAYTLRHAYDASVIEEARQTCLAECHRYLEALKASNGSTDVAIQIDAACESPLYEAIVHKVLKSRPDLVIKGATAARPLQRVTFSANDWQLMRTCPVTLMLTRGRAWRESPKWAAAVDVSPNQEAPELTRSILETSAFLAAGCHAVLDLVYCERAGIPVQEHEANAAALSQLAHELAPEAARIQVLTGEPEQVLPMFAAQHRYDVLVMGALTHRERLVDLVGTLTSRLVDALECDFVLVKPAGYQCPIVAIPERSTEMVRHTPPTNLKRVFQSSPALWQAFFGD